jgi:hypothetical protein
MFGEIFYNVSLMQVISHYLVSSPLSSTWSSCVSYLNTINKQGYNRLPAEVNNNTQWASVRYNEGDDFFQQAHLPPSCIQLMDYTTTTIEV